MRFLPPAVRIGSSGLSMLVLASLCGCGGDRGTSPAVAAITVTPSTAAMTVGGTLALEAQVTDDAGTPLSPGDVFWSTSDSAVARVSNVGVVTARKAGKATIAATARGTSATAAVTIANSWLPSLPSAPPTPPAPAAVASIDIRFDAQQIYAGRTTRAYATPRDANGNVLTGRTVTWSSRDTRVATVSSTGVITGLKNGSSVITATIEGKSVQETIHVRK